MPEETTQSQLEPTQTDTPVLGSFNPDTLSELDRRILETKWPQSRWPNVGRIIALKVMSDDTVLTTGDGKVIFHIPQELDKTLIIAAHAFVTTVSSSGAITVQIRNITDSLDVLSTALTIDQSEFDSYTAATPARIKFANAQLAKSDRLAIDVDGAGTGAKGLSVYISIQS